MRAVASHSFQAWWLQASRQDLTVVHLQVNDGPRMFQNRMRKLTAWVVGPGDKNKQAVAVVAVAAELVVAAAAVDVDSAFAAENVPVECEEKKRAVASFPVYAVFVAN